MMVKTLPVVESFHSLQGEGVHTGRSAFFIRLASCNVGCPWCDTKNSWSKEMHEKKTIIEIAANTARAQSKGAAFAVLTGGEPLHHNLDELCQKIRLATSQSQHIPIPIHIETSGVDPISGNPNWITLSPKRHAPPLREVLSACDELKVVIQEANDLLFAEDMATKLIEEKQKSFTTSQMQPKKNKEPFLFLQPGWNNSIGQDLAYEHVKKNSKWRLSMQTHKWLGIL